LLPSLLPIPSIVSQCCDISELITCHLLGHSVTSLCIAQTPCPLVPRNIHHSLSWAILLSIIPYPGHYCSTSFLIPGIIALHHSLSRAVLLYIIPYPGHYDPTSFLIPGIIALFIFGHYCSFYLRALLLSISLLPRHYCSLSLLFYPWALLLSFIPGITALLIPGHYCPPHVWPWHLCSLLRFPLFAHDCFHFISVRPEGWEKATLIPPKYVFFFIVFW
jgi:hypothetical protein